MVKISVIIPIYNAENYIEECIHSVIRQTFQDFEIVCVNDGSTDNSAKIIKTLQKNYPEKIIVFEQENMGTSLARKKAIDNSKGELIAYLDADDFVEEDYLQKLYKTMIAENADIVYCNYCKYKDGKIVKKYNKKLKIFKNKNKEKIYFATGAMKLLKKSLFEDVVFPKNVSYGEDSCISMQISINAKKVSICKDEPLYFYRIYSDSTINKTNSLFKNIYQIVRANEALSEFLHNKNIYEIYKDIFYEKFEKSIMKILDKKE